MYNLDSRVRVNRSVDSERESWIREKESRNNIFNLQGRYVGVRELLYKPDPQSSQFIPENDRWGVDFATAEHRRRLEEDYKRKLQTERIRLEMLERDSKKLTMMEDEDRRATVRQSYKQEVLSTGKRNRSGQPFNPITLQYDDSPEGNMLRKKDEMSQVRSYLRANNIDTRSNCGYNVLSGAGRRMIEISPQIQNDYSTEINQGMNDIFSNMVSRRYRNY